ncbi:MAG TPA: MoaD/ThiS family protein [Kofleriaceae bacterium]|nr:MoaD/ThiS family protein [Kofleriaceae bacterium]
MGLFGKRRAAAGGETIRVHVLVRGRIGLGWYDVDETVEVPAGTTLARLVADGDRYRLPLAAALRDSPHLSETLMWNGERCPVAEHGERALADGDELYLLAPLAGG